MVKRTISITLFFLLLTPMIINAQEDGKHKENKKIEKVTSVTMQHENEEQSDGPQDAEENEEALRKDFSTIRKEVEESSIPTVIKALLTITAIAQTVTTQFSKFGRPRCKKHLTPGY